MRRQQSGKGRRWHGRCLPSTLYQPCTNSVPIPYQPLTRCFLPWPYLAPLSHVAYLGHTWPQLAPLGHVAYWPSDSVT